MHNTIKVKKKWNKNTRRSHEWIERSKFNELNVQKKSTFRVKSRGSRAGDEVGSSGSCFGCSGDL